MSDWQTISGGRKRRHLNDGAFYLIGPGGQWEARLPNGTAETGTAPNEAAAQAACDRAHDAYVIAQWAKGQLTDQRRLLCPLT